MHSRKAACRMALPRQHFASKIWQQAACESVINIKAFYLLDGRGERRKSPAEMKIFIGLGEKVLRREKTRINEKK